MVALPLLGLLGLGVGSMAMPHVENYQNKTRGKYAQGLLAGVDTNDPNQTRDALFGGGLLSGKDFQGDSRTGFEGVQDREAAMARQRVASGPGYMNARLAREKFEAEQAALVQGEQYQRSVVAQHGTPQEQALINNPLATPQSVAGVFGNVTSRVFGQSDTQVANDAQMQTAAQIGGDRGATFGLLAPDDRQKIVQLENQVQDVTEATNYFNSADVLTRGITDRATAARYATQFRDAVVSYQQIAKTTGALQAADLEFIDSITGDPNKLLQLTDTERQRAVRITNVMKRDLAQQAQVYPGLYGTEAGQAFVNGLTQAMTFNTVSDTGRDLETVPKSGQTNAPQLTVPATPDQAIPRQEPSPEQLDLLLNYLGGQ